MSDLAAQNLGEKAPGLRQILAWDSQVAEAGKSRLL
jgi:hypothetical protein